MLADVSAILGLITSIFLAYFIFFRFTQLNSELDITGHMTEQTRVVLQAIRNSDTETDTKLTFIGFWLRFFQNIHTNIVKEDIDLIISFLSKSFDKSATDLVLSIKTNCNVNPTDMIDWVSSYIAPESLTNCIQSTTSAHYARYMAEQAMILSRLTKLSTDLYKMCLYAKNLAIGSMLILIVQHFPKRMIEN